MSCSLLFTSSSFSSSSSSSFSSSWPRHCFKVHRNVGSGGGLVVGEGRVDKYFSPYTVVWTMNAIVYYSAIHDGREHQSLIFRRWFIIIIDAKALKQKNCKCNNLPIKLMKMNYFSSVKQPLNSRLILNDIEVLLGEIIICIS